MSARSHDHEPMCFRNVRQRGSHTRTDRETGLEGSLPWNMFGSSPWRCVLALGLTQPCSASLATRLEQLMFSERSAQALTSKYLTVRIGSCSSRG